MFNIPSFFGFRAGGEPVPPYQQVLNYATSQGFTLPSAGQQILQEQLLDDLINAGIWDKLDTFAVLATDGNSDFALIDWKRLTQYTAVNSPTFSTNGGFLTNGTSSFLNTEFIGLNGVNYQQNDASRIFWVDTITGNQQFEGTETINGNSSVCLNSVNHTINSSNVGFTGANVNFALTEWHALYRASATDISLFTNTTRFDRVSTSLPRLNSKQTLGKRNILFGSHRFRIYAMGASLIAENTDFYNAINTYLTSI